MRIVAGTGATRLDLLVQQLWQPLLQDGTVEVAVASPMPSRPDAHERTIWVPAETYWVLPTAERAELLLPAGSPRVTSGAARAYRGLRRPAPALARTLLSVGTRVGLPAGTGRLTVRTLWNRPPDATELPAAWHSRRLDRRVHPSVGVRTGDNRKATLQLFDDAGRPAGYAKHAWNDSSDLLVANETRVLAEVGGLTGPMRVPGLLDHGDYLGHPFLTVAPMPTSVTAVRGAAPTVSAAELYALCPVTRHDRLVGTTQFAGVRERAAALGDAGGQGELAGALRRLVQALAERSDELPVGRRWHGDLTPWNCARDTDGQLWCWDWESSEADTPAGLDALHWQLAVAREAGPVDQVDLDGCVDRAGPLLRAAGVSGRLHRLLGAVLVATMVERAAGLAVSAGSWESSWITPRTATAWCRQAQDWA